MTKNPIDDMKKLITDPAPFVKVDQDELGRRIHDACQAYIRELMGDNQEGEFRQVHSGEVFKGILVGIAPLISNLLQGMPPLDRVAFAARAVDLFGQTMTILLLKTPGDL